MKIACVSDTHGHWPNLKYPPADILIFAGDILGNYDTCRGDIGEVAQQLNEIERLNELCKQLKEQGVYKEVIIVAGNHDWAFQKRESLCRDRLTDAIYLRDEMINIGGPNGEVVKFYGSPWQRWFWGWAFNFPDHNSNFYRARAHAQDCWDNIPINTDVLITHGPPIGILDATVNGQNVGDIWLKERLQGLMHLKLHVFGHIHYSYGTKSIDNLQFVNAAACGEDYKPDNPIQVVEI